jgi:hypothetical protein
MKYIWNTAEIRLHMDKSNIYFSNGKINCGKTWRLLILSNEEKTNDYENFEKGMIYMKIWKKGDSREKGGGGNEIHAPNACGRYIGRHIRMSILDWQQSSNINYIEVNID